MASNVLGQNNFNQNVSVLDVPLTLQATNTISVELWGSPGGTISVQVIGVDNDPPTIDATASPAANAAGWNNSAVTVTFACSDATSGVANCPAPQTVSAEGEGQAISGAAADLAGNEATASVTVNIDLTPPILAITSPTPGATLSDTSVTVAGSLSDALSGVASVTCNSVQASLTSTSFSCDVPLVTGSNTIQVVATDVAGNQASQSISVTVGSALNPPPTSVMITPGVMSLVVGEPRELALVDNLGRAVPGATWTVSDTSVAQIAGDAPSFLTGIAAGQVTITATYNDLSASATATVYAGPSLPQGTVRWSVPPAPGYSTIGIVQAVPAENAPDIYSVEQGAAEDQIIVRALTADGRELWVSSPNIDRPADTQFVFAQVPDGSGGLLLQTEDDSDYPPNSQIIRLDPATGQISWEYQSTAYLYHDLAVAPDGTIYVGEMPSPEYWTDETGASLQPTSYDVQMLAIDGQTGTVKERVPVPESYDWIDTGCWAPDPPNPYAEITQLGAPMVAPNGSMYVEVAVYTYVLTLRGGCAFSDQVIAQDTSLRLLQLNPDGSYQWTTLHDDPLQSGAGYGQPQPAYAVGEVIPDGQGGLLASWTYQQVPVGSGTAANPEAMVEHLAASGQSEYMLPLSPLALSFDYNGCIYIGGCLSPQDQTMVLGENGVAFETDGQSVVSFNVADGSVNWTSQPGGAVSLVAATEGNGLVVNEPTYDPSTYSYVSNIVQLDNTGNVADPFTVNTASLQYDVGDQWLALGSTDAVSGPAILWPFSVWATPTQKGTRQATAKVELRVFEVDGSQSSSQSVPSMAQSAVAYWAQKGILLDWKNEEQIHIVGNSSLLTVYPGNLSSVPPELQGFDGSAMKKGVNLFFTNIIGATAMSSTSVAAGYTIGLSDKTGYPSPTSTAFLNVSVFPGDIQGLLGTVLPPSPSQIVEHEIGHQFGLTHVIPSASLYNLLTAPFNLMCGGGSGSALTDEYFNSTLCNWPLTNGLSDEQIATAQRNAAKLKE